jgi:hypothetical protein
MTEANDLAAAAASPDPRIGLRAAVALRRLAEALEVLQVDNARLQGWSWQEIADALDVSRQAVHKKHAGRVPARPAAAPGAGVDQPRAVPREAARDVASASAPDSAKSETLRGEQ